MASSSSSSVEKSFTWDVFLSFRGEETRNHFVDHLFYALKNRGITTYKDEEGVKKGEKISDELMRSIEDSRYFIIVFSKNYASSSWCLNELVKIMECQKTTEQTAFPVFYHVEPTHIRNQTEDVKKAFEKHVGKEDEARWRQALNEAAGLCGLDLKDTPDGREAKFIQKIVTQVSLKLHSVSLSVDEKLVGMKPRVMKVVSCLETGFDKVQMIGIKGMGGCGKTTLARAVFDHMSISFECKSFVENVREVSTSSRSGLRELQKQVLKDVLNENIDVTSVSNMMTKRMRGRKVLLVLDDVDNIDQLEGLAGDCNWFKPGSKIIITTRDTQVLVAHGVRSDDILDVNLLLDEEAICLLSRYAFVRESPIPGYEELSRKVVHYAHGLPLTIKVLGSFLRGRTKGEWVDAIERVKKIPPKKILDILEISYNGLEDDQKEIFLDVACMLKGELKDEAIRILASCNLHAEIGLSVLEQKSLITISDTEGLGLHDSIANMGRRIVGRLCPHERLWIREDIEDILVKDLGSEATLSIKLNYTNLRPATIMKGLRKMKKLRFLSVHNEFESNRWYIDEVNQYIPDSLQYLYWSCYGIQCLPKTFQANNLVYLKMVGSDISHLWAFGKEKVLNKLRFLDLKFSKLETFDLSLTPNLERLDLRGCIDFVELHMPAECPKLNFLSLSGLH